MLYQKINVLGGELEPCSIDPLTGYYRDGTCNTSDENIARHTVCIYATKKFLAYSKKTGNDLSTPLPEYNFKGVNEGQSWCLSGVRFAQSILDNQAPQIFIHSTHKDILSLIDLKTLKKYAIDL
jgi:uncharacterized protein (DUF2237 family)